MDRRSFLKPPTGLRLLAGLAVAGLFGTASAPAHAQSAANWPDKPVKLIVPYAPGGASDLIGRPWADRLTQELKQPRANSKAKGKLKLRVKSNANVALR